MSDAAGSGVAGPAAGSGLGALSVLRGLTAATPVTFATKVVVGGTAVPAALANERNMCSLKATVAPTGLAPGRAAPGPKVGADPSPGIPVKPTGGTDPVETCAVNQYAASGAAALSRAAAQGEGPVPKVGASAQPVVRWTAPATTRNR